METKFVSNFIKLFDHNRRLKFGYRSFTNWPEQVGADEVKPETTAATSVLKMSSLTVILRQVR